MSPVPSTFIRAIANNNFISWPGLTPQLIKRHLSKKIATVQGHLKSERQGLQLTKKLTYKEQVEEEEEYFPPSEIPNIRTNQVCYSIIDALESTTAYVDLTGKFPKRSSRGNQYLLIGYHYDGNCILGAPLRDRRGTTIAEA